MSTVKVANIQHPNAASPSIVIDGTGAVQIGGESVATVADQRIAAASINDLSDVNAGSAVDGEVLVFSSGSWGSAQVGGGGGGGLAGTSYVFVAGDGTAAENGAALVAAYIVAAGLTPYGNALSDTNRASVVVAPGIYNLTDEPFSTLNIVVQFVNVVSLDGERSVNITSDFASFTAVNVTADNVLLRGIDGGTGEFSVSGDLDGLVVEKCRGFDQSFVIYGRASGTFTDCIGGDDSFGGFGGEASGTFTNCIGGERTFGGGGGETYGTFNNCVGGTESFGGGYLASGTFTNCVGGPNSFGGNGFIEGGLVLYCRLTGGTFETPMNGGKIRLSLDGQFAEVNAG